MKHSLVSTGNSQTSARAVIWICYGLLSLRLLLIPAVWNGFAIVFFDSGGYVCRVLEMNLAPGRSFFYGLFLWISSLGWRSFWGSTGLQSIFCLWCMYLCLRCLRGAVAPSSFLFICLTLSLFTGISWYTSQLMPDILIPVLVLILWLFSCYWQALSVFEKFGLTGVALLALLSHMSAMALALGLLTFLCLAAQLSARRHFRPTLFLMPAFALVLGSILAMPALHYLIFQHPGYTPGGPAFIFGRLVQDGIATRWLNDHCPRQGIRLCDVKNRLPQTADDFLWADTSPFRDIGSWNRDAEIEMRTITRESLREYPWLFFKTAGSAAIHQFISVATGDGLDEFQPATRGIFADLLPKTSSSFKKARQQNNGITRDIFNKLNYLHVPMSLAACCLLPCIIIWKFHRQEDDLAFFCTFILIALLANAAICGALSNPHDRYQSRIVWLAVFAILIIFLPDKRLQKEKK